MANCNRKCDSTNLNSEPVSFNREQRELLTRPQGATIVRDSELLRELASYPRERDSANLS